MFSTGHVSIRPDHEASTWRPTYWWLLTSRRWTDPRPINVYVIEHRDGPVVFDTGQDRASVTDPAYFPSGVSGFLYGRLARFDIGEDETFAAGLARLGYSPRGDSDLTYDARLLEHGHVPGVGNRRRLPEITAMTNQLAQHHPGLVILPAHEPNAAARLAAATSKSAPGPGTGRRRPLGVPPSDR